jgi:hypothetical protein
MHIESILSITHRNTGIALKYILDRGFNPAAGDRPDAKDVLVVLTDGISINPTHTADQAYIFKERHIKVISKLKFK